MCSCLSVILASTVTILVSFEAILIYSKIGSLPLKLTSKVDIIETIFKIPSILTSIVTLASIGLAGEHIFQVLAQYL